MAGLIVRPRSRILRGHDWVYASEILKLYGDPAPGSVISVKDGRDRMLGSAIFNPHSQIVARRFSRQRQDLDADFFERRIRLALEVRARHGVDPRRARLVSSESDGLPGLIVDRYGDQVVIQTLTLAMDLRKETIVQTLANLLDPAAIVERNDAAARAAEGLAPVTGTLRGAAAPAEISIAGGRFVVDPLAGHKTGFYLDQADNCAAVARLAPGRGVLDCFSYQGTFAIACALAGARSVTAVEISERDAAAIRANAARNAVEIDVVHANAFDHLRALEVAGARFDMVILDPPSFTRARGALRGALRGYKEIHLRAFHLLERDGVLATFCCSHHVDEREFLDVIRDALVDARRSARLLATLGQPPDHPVVLSLPETRYLKGALLEMMPGR